MSPDTTNPIESEAQRNDPEPDPIPLSRPWLGELEAEAVRKVLLSGWLIQGPTTQKFEEAMARYLEVDHAVAVASGTAALHLSLIALGVGPGDEVILPSHSFVATANTVVYVGAKPVYVDIDPKTYNLDPDLLEAAITTKTRALCVVHQSGLPADMDPILSIARHHDIAVYEDAACALGSRYKGAPIGSLSTLSCFSFHPRKVLTTGEGGMITTNSPELAQRLRILRQQGMTKDARARRNGTELLKTEFPVVGFNYRLTDISAAIGLAQLRRLPVMMESRWQIAKLYRNALSEVPHLIPPHVPEDRTHNYQSYVVRLAKGGTEKRDEVVGYLKAHGIHAGTGITCIHRQSPYRPYITAPLPHSEAATDETILLPFFPQMTEDQIQRVVQTLKQAMTR